MAAGRAADRASVAGYSGDSRQGSGSNSHSDSGSFGEGSMAAGRAADRASVAGYSGDSRQDRGSSSRSDSGSFGAGSMAAGRAADRASVAGYSADSRQERGFSSRSGGGSFGEGSMAAARAADRASVAGYSADRVSRDRASFDAMVNSMAAARAADRRSVPGYSADTSPSVSSLEAARRADAYAEYARSMLQAGRTLSGRFSSLPSGASAISMNGNWVSVSYPDRSVTTYNAARYGSVEEAIAASKRTVATQVDTVSNWANWATSVSVAIGQSVESLVNQSIRTRAAEIITRATAKNFPSNMAKAVELVGKLPATNPVNWASHVKAQWNYGLSLSTLQSALEKGQLPTTPASQSAQEIGKLLANNRTALTIGRIAGQVGMWAGPVIGAFGGVAKTPADASWGTWTANGITGFAKQVDNAAVAAVGFTLGAGVSAPSAPATVGVGPVVVGTATAYTLERAYDSRRLNKAIDSYIDAAGPYIGRGIDAAISWTD
jgi:hypothetical protein